MTPHHTLLPLATALTALDAPSLKDLGHWATDTRSRSLPQDTLSRARASLGTLADDLHDDLLAILLVMHLRCALFVEEDEQESLAGLSKTLLLARLSRAKIARIPHSDDPKWSARARTLCKALRGTRQPVELVGFLRLFLGDEVALARATAHLLPATPAPVSQRAALPERHRVALTFHDGPHHEHTAHILSTLKEHTLKAAFFVRGERAAAHPELVKAMLAAGHTVGCAGWTGQNLAQLLSQQGIRAVKQELSRTCKLLTELGHPDPLLISLPAQACSPELALMLQRHKLERVTPTLDSRDARLSRTWSDALIPLIREREDTIVLLRDAYQSDASELSDLITTLKRLSELTWAHTFSLQSSRILAT